MEPRIQKKVDEGNAYYTVYWSKLEKADKYRIISAVPAEAGIYELYYMDNHKQLNLMRMSRVWYGGLRSRLRRNTDIELLEDSPLKEKLSEYDCYYRYTIIRSFGDMQDILFFFAGRLKPGDTTVPDSGRYIDIYVEEWSPDKVVTV